MSQAFSHPFFRQHSWFEATARDRVAQLLDPASFYEFLPPEQSTPSPHLAKLDIPGAFDDGVIVGRGMLNGNPVLLAAQEGHFMGGAVGEIHGAKIVGLMRRALYEKPSAVLLLVDSGGVRLHEANAGLIAISEIMRAMLAVRAIGIPIFALIGGSCGAFGGMGIATCLSSAIIMSEEGRLALSGPEVIEAVVGVEEFDSRDRALVWRVTGGKHRYLMGDCQKLVDDDINAFREAATEFVETWKEVPLDLAHLRARSQQLRQRVERYTEFRDGMQVWAAMGVPQPEAVSMMDRESLVRIKESLSV